MNDVNEVILNRRDLATALDAVYRCAATEGHLAGVFFSLDGETLKTVATNGNMVALFRAFGAGTWVEGEAFKAYIDLRDIPTIINWLKYDSALREKCHACLKYRRPNDNAVTIPVCRLSIVECCLRIKIDDHGRSFSVRLLNTDDFPNYEKVIPKVNDNRPDRRIGINPAFLDIVYKSFNAINAHMIVFEPSGELHPFVWSHKSSHTELLIVQMPMRQAGEFIRA